MKFVKNNKGVTLAELLAVITIMGIIAAIAIPAIGNVITTSRVGAAESDAVAIFEAARVKCTVENCNSFDASGLTQDDMTSFLDGSIEGTFNVDISGGKPINVVYTLDEAPDGTNRIDTYTPGNETEHVWS